MSGKKAGSPTTMIAPRGPSVGGPSGLAGPSLLNKILGPMNAQALANQNSFKDTAAPIVGTIAGIITSLTPAAPLAGLATVMADRTVREQVNVVNGRPFFEGVGKNGAPGWNDLISVGAGVIAGGAGGAVGGAVGGATGSAAAGTVANQATRAGINYGLGQLAGYLNRTAPIGGRRRVAPTPISGLGQQLPLVYAGYR